ncbi:MAG: NAD-dependent epimerase/dehydratase family protein [Flavobacteriaceae bacterium]
MKLVTGATGIVGSHLVGIMLKNGQNCVAIYRGESKKKKAEKYLELLGVSKQQLDQQLQWKKADLLDIVAVEEAFENITHVYHCAAKVSFSPDDDSKVLETNIQGTSLLVDLSIKYKIQKFAFVSSIAALGSLHGQTLNEESTWNPERHQTAYAWSKYLSEMEVWRGQEEGLPTVIVNPGIILTNAYWRRSSGAFTHRAKKSNSYYPPAKTGFVTASDVAQALYTLMQENIQGERFILVAKNATYKSIFADLARPWQHEGPSRLLSKNRIWLFYCVDYILGQLKLKKRALSKGLIDNLFSTATYDGQKIERLSSFRYTPWEAGIETIHQRKEWFNAD